MSVKRYQPAPFNERVLHATEDGEYVKYEDFAALEQRLIESERYGRQADITIENLEQKLAESQHEFRAADATIENLQMQLEKMAAENSGLREACGGDGSYRNCPACAHTEYIEAPETPSTEAFLAEVRAQGVEMFAKEMHADISGDDARDFAAQIRKGVQS